MKHLPALSLSILLLTSQAAWAETFINDPYEGYNRWMFKVNDSVDRAVVTPVARGYRAVTPSPVRTGVSNFFNNLRDVVSIGSNLLRLDIEKASTDLVRVGLNSTFGLGGLIDIAGAAQMPNNKSTLGDTFASWGWKNSNYFVYPLLGPSTVRDSIGNTITNFYPIENALFNQGGWRYGLSALKVVDKREQYLDLTDSVDMAALDSYAYTRDVFMAMRAKQIGTTYPPNDSEGGVDIDQLVEPDSSNGDNSTAPATTAQPEQIDAAATAYNKPMLYAAASEMVSPSAWSPSDQLQTDGTLWAVASH